MYLKHTATMLFRQHTHKFVTHVRPITTLTSPKSFDCRLLRDQVCLKALSSNPVAICMFSSMGQSSSVDKVEQYVCDVNDMNNGEMKEVEFEGLGKALVVKDDGEYHAIGPKCTHFGAPLVKGSLRNGRVRCPWHGACFDVKTGDIEDYPGLDCVPKHEIVIKGCQVFVRADKEALSSHKRYKSMVQTVQECGPHVLIIGGGPASVTCAEMLRQKSFTGRITIASKESHLPYDRTKLSKAMDIDPEKIYLRTQKFYDSVNIKILTEHCATEVDLKEKKVGFENGDTIKYDKLVLATGGSPRTLPVDGWGLKNVFVLRTPDDAKAIINAARDKTVVICGASFIGMEVASSLASKAKKVSVCEFFKVPFERVLGREVGKYLQNMHESKGVEFHMGTSMEKIVGGCDGEVTHVLLQGGDMLEADVVVAGVGVVPSTSFLQGTGIGLARQGFVNVDKHLRVVDDSNNVIPDVYAAGDIVMYPQKLRDWQPSNIQHYQMAQFHGRTVGSNIVMEGCDYDLKTVDSVPFFWTVQYGKSIRYTGYGFGYDDIVIKGDVEAGKFCAYYTKGEDVIAVATLGSDPVAADVAQRLYDGTMVKKGDL